MPSSARPDLAAVERGAAVGLHGGRLVRRDGGGPRLPRLLPGRLPALVDAMADPYRQSREDGRQGKLSAVRGMSPMGRDSDFGYSVSSQDEALLHDIGKESILQNDIRTFIQGICISDSREPVLCSSQI